MHRNKWKNPSNALKITPGSCRENHFSMFHFMRDFKRKLKQLGINIDVEINVKSINCLTKPNYRGHIYAIKTFPMKVIFILSLGRDSNFYSKEMVSYINT